MTDDYLIGGLPDFQKILAEREREARETAMGRARKGALLAYPVIGFGQGWLAVPSQSELGSVYLVHLNIFNGDPNSCTCPNPRRWCTHAGAARCWYDAMKDAEDTQRAAEAAANIIHLQKERMNAD